jgi:hypothetical protein
LRQAANLKDQIEALEKQLSQLTGTKTQSVVAPAIAKAPTKKGSMSAAGKARIVAAQKARWAKIKAAKPAATAVKVTKAVLPAKPAAKVAAVAAPAKKKFTMSAAAKAKISAAAKARWAKIKAAKK